MAGAAAALIASGCGGDDKPEKKSATARTTPTVAIDPQGPPLSKSAYEKRFKATITRFENSPEIDAPADASLDQEADAFAKGLDRIRELAAALGRLNPPAEVRQAHVDYVNGMRAIADDGERIVDALRRGDEEEANKLASGQFADQATVRKLAAARAEFERKGYDLAEVSQFP